MMVRAGRTGVLIVAGLGLVVLVAGCRNSNSNKAGGPRAKATLVMTMADWSFGLSVGNFANQVARLSGGTMRIDLKKNWRLGQSQYENGLIGDVRAGKADLGVAGSRAWDSMGVNSFRALHAPFLIDSYALQERVLRSDLIGKMLPVLTRIGLVGLGVLPGPMRKPLGIAHPLVRPSDYRGLTIGVQQSRVADQTMRALGAKPVWFPSEGPIKGFAGIEQQVSSIEGNHYDRIGKYLTANVNLWPRPIVLFANGKFFGRLTSVQQNILRKAVAAAITAQTAFERDDQRAGARALCRAGRLGSLRLVTASPSDLVALRRAVRPVFDRLREDPLTRHSIAAIVQLKRELTALGTRADTLPACAHGTHATAGTPTPIDGVYSVVTTAADLRAAGAPQGDVISENYGAWIYVFDRGRFAFTQENGDACGWGYGKFTVTGHQMAWTFSNGGGIAPNGAHSKPGEFFRFGWSLYRGTLSLTPVVGAVSPENFRAKPWRLISATPSRRYLSKRCPPPAAALTR